MRVGYKIITERDYPKTYLAYKLVCLVLLDSNTLYLNITNKATRHYVQSKYILIIV